METKTVKKKKLSVKKLLIIFLVLYCIGCFIYYIIKLPIKNIYITGTSLIQDVTVIEAANIKNYPGILKTSSNSIRKKVESLELVKSAKVKKNVFGKLTIEIEEYKVLFYNRSDELLILDDKSEIEMSSEYFGISTLINYVPDKIYEKLLAGLMKVDKNVLSLVSEIEYAPSKAGEVVIDDTRFLLRMNDGNSVYINTINVNKFNNYPEIYSTLDNRKGTLNMDSSAEENFYFIEFGSEIETKITDEGLSEETESNEISDPNE